VRPLLLMALGHLGARGHQGGQGLSSVGVRLVGCRCAGLDEELAKGVAAALLPLPGELVQLHRAPSHRRFVRFWGAAE